MLQLHQSGEDGSHSFLFDQIFSDEQTNLDVFTSVLQPLIPQLLDGYNVSCFAYGMTGSGKTHTMLGQFGGVTSQQEEQAATEAEQYEQLKNFGLCNLAIQNLFYQMFQRQDDSTYQVTVSYLEIYNEQVRDLLAELKDYEPSEQLGLKKYIKRYLNDSQTAKESRYDQAFNPYNVKKPAANVNLKIVEDPVKGVQVQNL